MEKLVTFYYRARSQCWRLKRLLFMSDAEARFIELMGGRVWTIDRVRLKSTGFRLAYYWDLGPQLKSEHYKREVRYGRYFVDFANDLNRIIEVDGRRYHNDVLADMDREIYICELVRARRLHDARFLRVPAYRIWNNAARVQQDVMSFIQ